ncbi:MAG: 50S ribosomal protein L28, partial [bacterium]|nr:50S ribosomal protein L28 [bacterium]
MPGGRAPSRKCEICSKGAQYGNRVSHAHNTSRHRWRLPNLQRIEVYEQNGFFDPPGTTSAHARCI